MNAADQVKRELRDGLSSAMKERRVDAVTALRSALAAIDNAESVEPAHVPIADSPIAGSAGGLGASEVERAHLGQQEQRTIVEREIVELASHIDRLTRLCRRDEADATRRAMEILRGVVQAQTSTKMSVSKSSSEQDL